MQQWVIVNQHSGRPLNDRLYLSENAANQDIGRLGESFARIYWAIPFCKEPKWTRILTEGFKAGDLEGILLPQFSIDVYVPGDPKTDNIVIGFLIKGVPEAVFPFKNFCTYSRGVKHVDYGDSDTLPNTSIVYVEFDRARFSSQEFDDLVNEVCRLSKLVPEDFSVSFPNTNKTYPYDVEIVEKYFRNRNEEKNRLAQLAAVDARTKQIQKELEKEMEDGKIGKSLGGVVAASPTFGSRLPSGHARSSLRQLRRGARPPDGGRRIGAKSTPAEINDATKSMIVNDAKRNLASHTETWEQFDNRWAARLHVTPSRVSTIRKRIYSL